jgi:DNA-binding transcriptional ArsR family regulator
MRDALDGDKAATREFQRTSYPDLGHWQRTLRRLLPLGAEGAAQAINDGLRGWYDGGFRAMEPEIAAEQERSASVARDLVARRDLDAVLEQLAPTITFTREVGQEEVVLSPSVIVRPGWALSDYGPTLVIAYPIAEASDASDGQHSADQLVRLAKAMGDELRLRALRELRAGPMSATELSRRLGVPRTTIHHHLSILVSAGLLRVSVDDARWGNFELRPEAAAELGRLAEELLGPS